MVTWGTTAPDASVTVPTIAAESLWAWSTAQKAPIRMSVPARRCIGESSWKAEEDADYGDSKLQNGNDLLAAFGRLWTQSAIQIIPAQWAPNPAIPGGTPPLVRRKGVGRRLRVLALSFAAKAG